MTVLTPGELAGERAHYLPALLRAGATHRPVPLRDPRQRLPRLGDRQGRPLPAGLVAALDRHCNASTVLPLVAALLADPPDVLHCWLDEPNVTGALAGLAARLPRIVIATRGESPARAPRLERPWFRDAYRALLDAPGVTWLANSAASARDYAAWAGLDASRIQIVPNGFPLGRCRPADAAERAAGRRALGLDPEAFLVVGVLRLESEKRPVDFVEALAAARARVPGLRGLLLGAGSLRPEVEARAAALGLAGALRLLGRHDDPWSVLRLADASLLTSESESCPNAVIESQAHEVPVVLTDAGGCPETVIPGQTGLLCPVGDTHAMGAALARLAGDPALRVAMGRRGRSFVAERFDLEAMVRRTLALYDR